MARMHFTLRAVAALIVLASGRVEGGQSSAPATPSDVQPGSITYEDVAYPHPVEYLAFTTYGQDVRMAYMDVAPSGAANGRVVLLLHGFNFGGFYFENTIDLLRREGFRVVAPDQIGFARSSKPVVPYTFTDHARNTKRLLDHLNIAKASVVGHSMGGMLSARFASQYPGVVERLVIYNPIGLTDRRFDKPLDSVDERYKTALASTYQSQYASIFRYFSHNPAAWKPEYERFVRVRYARTLSADFPRYAMVEALLRQMMDLDTVVYDWPHIKAPTLAIGGAEDSDPIAAAGAAPFRDRMKVLADSIPNGNGRALLLPGLGHVPHLEAPERFHNPVLTFLKEGLAR
jgi:pimeloyl-ACP methyl ester carboxylesterase